MSNFTLPMWMHLSESRYLQRKPPAFLKAFGLPGLDYILRAYLKSGWPVPPLEEQRTIVAYIKQEMVKLDALREATVRTIGLSKERRAALIAAAVTGKIEVGEVTTVSI